MKTIIYPLIVIFIFIIIAMSFTTKSISTSRSIVVQSIDKQVSSVSLEQSAKIISDRLKNFSSEKFNVTVIPEKSQIKVSLVNNWDINTVENLLIQKGELSFYESYNRKDLSEVLNGNNHLFSLLNMANVHDHDAYIGCIFTSELDKINSFLSTIKETPKCKFVWSQLAENSETCLYALRLSEGKGALIGGSDVESIKSIQDKTLKNFDIEIRFKKSAVDAWANATKRNINKAIVIVLDNKVIYSPVLKTEINDGICSITGKFSESEANFFASVANNGVLPIDFKIVK